MRPKVSAEDPASTVGGIKGSGHSSAGSGAGEEIPQLVSGETLESLVAQGDGVSYAALSLWLLNANAGEMAAFWENFRKGEPGGDLKRLLFINWTRLDPMAAIGAVKGTDNEMLVWWAWAAHDPATAMAAADPEMQKRVAKGAGEFHPEWVRENFDSIPEDARASAIEGIRTWKEDEDHAATMDFLVEHGSSPGNLFKTFARKDPWGAFDWLEKNDRLKVSRYGGNWELNALISEMKDRNPDDLERMASMVPSSSMKRMMEEAVFENLLATDPERALEQARDGKAPFVNAKRLAAIGSSLLSTDPEKAFELGGEIFSTTNGTLSPSISINWEGGGINWGSSDSTARSFIDRLLDNDPYRTLDMAVTPESGNSDAFRSLSLTVAEKDLDGYAAWVNRLPDSKSRARGSDVVVSKLAQKGHFNEASEWVLSGYNPTDDVPGSVYNLVYQWAKSDYSEASKWLDSSAIGSDDRNKLKSFMERNAR